MLKEGVRSLQPGRLGHRPKIVGDDHGNNGDTIKAIESAQYRFAASMADLERCYDEQASRLRAAFVADVAALYQDEAA
jgi:hypothetical protein